MKWIFQTMVICSAVAILPFSTKKESTATSEVEFKIPEPLPGDEPATRNATMANIDAEAEKYIPYNTVYTKNEAITLRNNLTSLLAASPNSQALNWALVKYYASAPNYVGGNKSMALRYAANLYSLNYYAGCLAYEHVYDRSYEFKNAEMWYKKSLIATVPNGMQWKEFKYINNAPFGVGVKGSFTNYKIKPLYESHYGSYVRKVMMPICNGNCEGEIVVGFMRWGKQKSNEIMVTSY
ncbi:MAG: hypothetical protein ACOVMI_05745 [Chitinophagaceae bacterium]